MNAFKVATHFGLYVGLIVYTAIGAKVVCFHMIVVFVFLCKLYIAIHIFTYIYVFDIFSNRAHGNALMLNLKPGFDAITIHSYDSFMYRLLQMIIFLLWL